MDEKGQEKLTILLVEDVTMFLSIACELLKEHDVKTAKTVKEALESYHRYKPDITFLDIKLPDGNGHDVLREIKLVDKDAFVMMVSASRSQEDIDKATEQGAHGYIMKPFSMDGIQEAIAQYRNRKLVSC